MSLSDRIHEIRTGFHKTFWVANTLELFERLAFYGSKAVLTVYLATKVGLGDDAGTLAGFFNLVLYFMPVLGGVFVDRYGFKRTLIVCFAFFTVGYFLIGLAGLEFGQHIVGTIGTKPYIIGVLLLTAIGGSLIKPCIVGTVEKTSTPQLKSLGFSIYYTLVNLGGAIGPILALQVRKNIGIEYVLVMSSITSLLLLLGTLFFFREPESHDGTTTPQLSFGKVFNNMLLVFTNSRFMIFLLIFSGFWAMFWQIFYLFPFYIQNVLMFPDFEILETVDAWTIILVSVPIAAMAKKLSPIIAMTLGFVIASCSWLIIAYMPNDFFLVPIVADVLNFILQIFSSESVFGPAATVAAIAMICFAVGEATQAPRYYEYVGALAPKEQVGTFMGFAFLPVAIGSFAAGVLSDFLRHNYLEATMNPQMMWIILAGIGFGSTALMLVYNFTLAKKRSV